jgi:hypothetical protein
MFRKQPWFPISPRFRIENTKLEQQGDIQQGVAQRCEFLFL